MPKPMDQYGLSDAIWKGGLVIRDQISQVLDAAIANAEDPLVTAKKLEQYLDPSQAPVRNVNGKLVKNQAKSIVTKAPGRGGMGSFPARRLARTEMTATFGDRTIQTARTTPWITGVKWNVSAAHPEIDECDDRAQGGKNGDGVYPPGAMPDYPAHPQCLCFLTNELGDLKGYLDQMKAGAIAEPEPEPAIDVNDPAAVEAWLKDLVKQGHLTPGQAAGRIKRMKDGVKTPAETHALVSEQIANAPAPYSLPPKAVVGPETLGPPIPFTPVATVGTETLGPKIPPPQAVIGPVVLGPKIPPPTAVIGPDVLGPAIPSKLKPYQATGVIDQMMQAGTLSTTTGEQLKAQIHSGQTSPGEAMLMLGHGHDGPAGADTIAPTVLTTAKVQTYLDNHYGVINDHAKYEQLNLALHSGAPLKNVVDQINLAIGKPAYVKGDKLLAPANPVKPPKPPAPSSAPPAHVPAPGPTPPPATPAAFTKQDAIDGIQAHWTAGNITTPQMNSLLHLVNTGLSTPEQALKSVHALASQDPNAIPVITKLTPNPAGLVTVPFDPHDKYAVGQFVVDQYKAGNLIKSYSDVLMTDLASGAKTPFQVLQSAHAALGIMPPDPLSAGSKTVKQPPPATTSSATPAMHFVAVDSQSAADYVKLHAAAIDAYYAPGTAGHMIKVLQYGGSPLQAVNEVQDALGGLHVGAKDKIHVPAPTPPTGAPPPTTAMTSTKINAQSAQAYIDFHFANLDPIDYADWSQKLKTGWSPTNIVNQANVKLGQPQVPSSGTILVPSTHGAIAAKTPPAAPTSVNAAAPPPLPPASSAHTNDSVKLMAGSAYANGDISAVQKGYIFTSLNKGTLTPDQAVAKIQTWQAAKTAKTAPAGYNLPPGVKTPPPFNVDLNTVVAFANDAAANGEISVKQLGTIKDKMSKGMSPAAANLQIQKWQQATAKKVGKSTALNQPPPLPPVAPTPAPSAPSGPPPKAPAGWTPGAPAPVGFTVTKISVEGAARAALNAGQIDTWIFNNIQSGMNSGQFTPEQSLSYLQMKLNGKPVPPPVALTGNVALAAYQGGAVTKQSAITFLEQQAGAIEAHYGAGTVDAWKKLISDDATALGYINKVHADVLGATVVDQSGRPVVKPTKAFQPQNTVWAKLESGQWDSFKTNAPKDEVAAISSYKVSGYIGYNNHLRGIRPTTSKSTLKEIDELAAALEKTHLPVNIQAYRGVSLSSSDPLYKKWISTPPGAPITEPAFMSISTDISVAKRFAGGHSSPGSILFNIEAPAGTKGLFIDPVAGKGGLGTEKEFLVQKGSSVIVERIEKNANGSVTIYGRLKQQ